MNTFRFVLIVAAMFSSNIVHAQETIQPGCDDRSEDVLQKCVEAMGGMSLVEAANLKLSGKLAVKLKMGSEELEFIVNGETELVQVGRKSSYIVKRENSVHKMISDGRTRWGSNDGKPFQEQTAMPHPPDWTPWPRIVMTWDEFNQITFLGEENLDGQSCWKLQFEHVDGQKSVRFFDKASGLPFQFLHTSTVGENRTTFGFVPHEDWMLPLKQTIQIDRTDGGNQRSEIEYEVTELGFEDDAAGFSTPPSESDR